MNTARFARLKPSRSSGIIAVAALALSVTLGVVAVTAQNHAGTAQWAPRGAASYLDGRMAWWVQWPGAARDHDTSCVSCHTALPYALARPALRKVLGEHDLAAPERTMLSHVVKRVTLWRDVDPWYSDQRSGLPKTSESRGTEAIFNALVLANRDAHTGTITEETGQAFRNLWALQLKVGDLKGAWAWMNFHYEPWESGESAYYGAALAALAVGLVPGGYASSPEIQDQINLLRDYLLRGADKERLFNRLTLLWASSKLPNLLPSESRDAIVAAALAKQQEDGGWSMAQLGSWKRMDGTSIDTASDGYATGLVIVALRHAGVPRTDARLVKALAWLERHQDGATGMWPAASLNKQRDPASDVGKFMSDAATAYAALALVEDR